MTGRDSDQHIGYYPGCMSIDCARELDRSLRAVLAALKVEWVEIPDWNCCGGLVADSVSGRLPGKLAGRVLELGRQTGSGILCACPVCLRRLKSCAPDAQVRGAVQFLAQPHYLQQISQRAEEKLDGLKAVCYGGPDSNDEERSAVDLLVETCGLQTLKWPSRKAPHGGSTAWTAPAVLRRLAGKVLTDAIDAGADLIVLADPHAQFNLDCFQYPIGKELGRAVEIPVLFASELVAHVLGLPAAERCYRRHVTSPFGLFLDYYDRRQAVMSKTRRSGGKT